ncbi:MAG: hypothetical protein V4459_12175 [Pseudomonadota bacterium]
MIASRAIGGMLLALALGSPVAATRAQVLQPSQCRAAETVVYSCRFGASVGSLCGSKGKLSYRFGPAGRAAIDIASDAKWSNVRTGTVIGGGGGRQNYARFNRDGYDYVVFEATAGQLTDVPGKRWSGIHVQQGDKDVSTLECKGRATLLRGGFSDLSRFKPAGVEDTEDTDPRFDMWF